MRSVRRFAAALIGAALICASPKRGDAAPPNVILYVIDTLRADHLGSYGYGRDTSPFLDSFARDAVRFERAYSTSSWTRPAAASILSGAHPLRHRAITRANSIAADVPLLSELLRGAGYRTEGFVTNVHVLPRWGFGRGFDSYQDVGEETRNNRSDAVNREVSLRSTPSFLSRLRPCRAAKP
jgi:arylsulfatase A-like enzyme